VLAARAEQLQQPRALYRADHGDVGNLAALQAHAAELQLLEMSWVTLPREGPAVPVELRLRVLGEAERLPILVAGLHRQSRPAQLKRLRVRRAGEAVVAELDLRFHRPPQLDEDALAAAWAQRGGDPSALPVLEAAGRVELLADFERALPYLDAQARQARVAVMQHLPLALSRLDEHEAVTLSWDGELLLDPPLEALLAESVAP
jgi:tryptophan 2,3-dioxygenase